MMLSHTHTRALCILHTTIEWPGTLIYKSIIVYAQLWLEVHFDISVPSRVSVVDESVEATVAIAFHFT